MVGREDTMTLDLISNEKGFREHVIERLAARDLDFVEQMELIRTKQGQGERWAASGVLVPIEFDQDRQEYVIILNKRSIYLLQPGDLCCPGGGMDRRLDRIMGYLVTRNVIPSVFSGPFRKLPRLPGREREIFVVILAGVLRESWEEMRLNPCNVEYLGSLPIQQMQSFPRFIFPVVGRIRRPWKPRLNWEVESIVKVPIRSFLDPGNYAIYSQRIPASLKQKTGVDRWDLPCLVVRQDGSEEILWGATFMIILNFLHTAIDLPIDAMHPHTRIERDLPPDYFTGKERKKD
jgi:hypothetical protein